MIDVRQQRPGDRRLHADPNILVLAPSQARVTRNADSASIDVTGHGRVTVRLVVAADGRQSRLRGEAGASASRPTQG